MEKIANDDLGELTSSKKLVSLKRGWFSMSFDVYGFYTAARAHSDQFTLDLKIFMHFQ